VAQEFELTRLFQTLRLSSIVLSAKLNRITILLIGFVFSAAFAIIYALPQERSFLIDAQTTGIKIVYDGSARTAWRMSQVVVCIRKSKPNSYVSAITHKACSAQVYEVNLLKSLNFVWPAGSKIQITATEDSGLVVDILDVPKNDPYPLGVNRSKVTAKGRIVIPGETFRGAGGLVFSGFVDIGAVPKAGILGLLQAGRYEIRETLPLRSSPITVSSGDLYGGDSITIMKSQGDKETPQTTFGFITAGKAGETAFNLVAYSALAHSYMRVSRFSSAPATVAPSWADRAIRDPYLLGVTAFLTLVAILVSIVSDLPRVFSRPDVETKPQSTADPDQSNPPQVARAGKKPARDLDP